jgi:small-conductance mechanosensitive channel
MKPFKFLLAALLLLFATTGSGWAQLSGAGTGDKPKAEPQITEPQTQEAVRELLSGLDDTQVRELLLKRMSDEVDRRARALAAENETSFTDTARLYARSLRTLIVDAVSKVPAIPTGFAKAWANFTEQRGGRDLISLWLGLAGSLAAGFAAAYFTRRPAASLERYADTVETSGPLADLGSVVLGMAARFVPLAAFVIVAGLTDLLFNAAHAPDTRFTARIIATLAWIGLTIIVVRLALTPTLRSWRTCPVASEATEFLVWRLGLVAVVFNVGFGINRWLQMHGTDYRETWFAFWVNLAVHAILIATIWQGRRGISAIVAGSDQLARDGRHWFATWWPMLMIVALVAHWLVVVLIVATSAVVSNLASSMAITLALLTGIPVISHALRALIERLFPLSEDQSPALNAADKTTQAGFIRISRVVLASLMVVALLKLWNVNLMSMAQQSMGSGLASSLVNIALIAGVAYAVWELIDIVINRQIAKEQVALGLDTVSAGSPGGEGEGGGAGARLGTLLPLVKIAAQFAIVVLSGLAILGELGVNILPLLAGAGVVGLAIGFGAQTLVKDIISGVFFLIDDAFRKGEYIDIGSVKGTVEKISLRSMQLRHHNGPLHTIPFGDIRHVTNFSRDWVIMKLSLRLTYDTDAEKVRKLIKKLGQEMAEEPNLKPLFLQPLKSQGVIEMQDSAQIMRVKFMTRPGDQWGLRRVVFARIRDLFEKEGIRFASREVVVRIADHQGERELTEAEQEAVAAAAARVTEPEPEVESAPKSEPALTPARG